MSSEIPEGSVQTVPTYGEVGKCLTCGRTEFNVTAMVKSFAQVLLNSKSGDLNIDTSDFKPNVEESEVTLETADDLIVVGRSRYLPDRVKEKVFGGSPQFDPLRYVIIRCDACGTIFDYGDKQVVLGLED